MAYDFQQAQGVQRRTVAAELRATGDFVLEGYASVFNTWSRDLGGFVEQVKLGAFTRSLREGADVKCLFNHEPDNILGRTKSGTLTLAEDTRGLKIRCQLNPKSQAHRDLYESVSRGDVDEMSFAFTVRAGGQSWADGKDPDTGEACAQRTLTNLELIDVSPVVFPAYPGTAVGARAQRSGPNYGARAASRAGTAVDDGAITRLRKLAASYCSEFRYAFDKVFAAIHPGQKRDAGAVDEIFRNRLEMGHQMSELCCSYAGLVRDALDAIDDDDSFDDEDVVDENTREAFRMARIHADLAAKSFASARMNHSRHCEAKGMKWTGKARIGD